MAVELPDAAVRTLDLVGRQLRELDAGWKSEKWAAPDVMHVTLRFLGEIDVAQAARIETDFAQAASCVPAFELDLAGLRAVPSSKRASMIWTRIDDPTGQCAHLAQEAERIAIECGLDPEPRCFVPHVTLVRARRPHAVRAGVLEAAELKAGMCDVGSMSVLSASLFASTLTPRGPIHERLRKFELQAGTGR